MTYTAVNAALRSMIRKRVKEYEGFYRYKFELMKELADILEEETPQPRVPLKDFWIFR